ncbi:hypothetical protein ABZV91_31250 [Nocardia sp. NPDC004568]|uniref:hypothetical protein n=1 Tax=Nocardia sp. NPDC004568 TaxID=3154551 RepID=UPI0033B46546
MAATGQIVFDVVVDPVDYGIKGPGGVDTGLVGEWQRLPINVMTSSCPDCLVDEGSHVKGVASLWSVLGAQVSQYLPDTISGAQGDGLSSVQLGLVPVQLGQRE